MGFRNLQEKLEKDINFLNFFKGADYILYEEVDASNVETIQLTANEHQKFPKAGATNTKSHLKIVEFEYSRPLKIGNKFDIYEHFPWCEYIVRMDWTPDGQR